MKINCLPLFLLFILIMQGCSFKPGGEQFVELDQTGKEPNLEVKLNFDTDTIFVNSEQWITFSYAPNGDQVNWAQFTIDGKETNRMEEKSGMIQLSRYFKNGDVGTFPMNMKVFLKSGTGSIAEKVGAEGYLLEKKWTLVITDRYHMRSVIRKTEFVDGSLKIHWETFKGMDFKNYKIYKGVPSSGILIASISSQQQTSFVDNTYHGEESHYYTVVNDEYLSPEVIVKGPLPVLLATNQADGNIVLKWNRPPFYKNLKGYRVAYKDPQGNFQQLMEFNNTAVDSFVVASPYFAYDYEFYLILLPLSDSYYDEWTLPRQLSSKATASYGLPGPKFASAYTGMAPESYLLMADSKINVFDHHTFTITKTIQYNTPIYWMDLSSNNRYLLSLLQRQGRIYLNDLVEPAKSKMLDLLTQFPQIVSIPSVSDVGTGIVINGQSVVLYDYIHETKLGEVKVVNNGLSVNKISPVGDFFFCVTYIGYEYYQYKDKQIRQLQPLNTLNEHVIYADYLPGTDQKLIRVIGDRVEVVDCNTWTIEKTWMFTDPIKEFYNLDMSSRKLFLKEGENMILLDIETGTRELLATTLPSGFQNPWNIFYHNRQVLWGQGKFLNLGNQK